MPHAPGGSEVVMSWGLGGDLRENPDSVASWFEPGASYLAFLSFNVIICKMGIKMLLTS